MTHARPATYKRGCRCPACRAAWAAYTRTRRQQVRLAASAAKHQEAEALAQLAFQRNFTPHLDTTN